MAVDQPQAALTEFRLRQGLAQWVLIMLAMDGYPEWGCQVAPNCGMSIPCCVIVVPLVGRVCG
jgi:hypothetical protein